MKPLRKEEFFKRQTTLSEIGIEGQEKLQNATVLVVGCGGLGSLVAVSLATSGVGKLHIIDYDTVAMSNLHRQFFYTLDDVGQPKASVLAQAITERSPFTQVTFSSETVSKKNVISLLTDVDIVVDATDSLPIKYLLNDACVLQNKPLVYGSLYKFDGYVATFNIAQKEGGFSCDLRDAFPEMATDLPNCSEAGTLNTIVTLIATLQANEVLKLITNTGKLLINQLLIYNSLQNSQLKIKLKPTDSCHSERMRRISKVFKNESYFDASCETQNLDWLLSKETLKEVLTTQKRNQYHIVSLIKKEKKHPFSVDEFIDIKNIKKMNIYSQKDYIFVCQKGITSYKAVKILKELYPLTTMLSLVDGIERIQ